MPGTLVALDLILGAKEEGEEEEDGKKGGGAKRRRRSKGGGESREGMSRKEWGEEK